MDNNFFQNIYEVIDLLQAQIHKRGNLERLNFKEDDIRVIYQV